MAFNYSGLDLGSGIGNFGQIMAQGYKDKIALEQHQRAQALQEAYMNEQANIAAQQANASTGYMSDRVQRVPYVAGAIAGMMQPQIPMPTGPQMPYTPQAQPGPYAPGVAPPMQQMAPQAASGSPGVPGISQLSQMFPQSASAQDNTVTPFINKAAEEYQNKQLQLQNNLLMFGAKAGADKEKTQFVQEQENKRSSEALKTKKDIAQNRDQIMWAKLDKLAKSGDPDAKNIQIAISGLKTAISTIDAQYPVAKGLDALLKAGKAVSAEEKAAGLKRAEYQAQLEQLNTHALQKVGVVAPSAGPQNAAPVIEVADFPAVSSNFNGKIVTKVQSNPAFPGVKLLVFQDGSTQKVKKK